MIQTPYHGLTSVALGRCPEREVGTFTPFQPWRIGDVSFYHDGVGTGFIPAFMHGAFCGTGQTGLCCGLVCISEDFWD